MVFGDPHFITFDGTLFTFNAWGEFWLVRVTDSPGVDDMNWRREPGDGGGMGDRNSSREPMTFTGTPPTPPSAGNNSFFPREQWPRGGGGGDWPPNRNGTGRWNSTSSPPTYPDDGNWSDDFTRRNGSFRRSQMEMDSRQELRALFELQARFEPSSNETG